MIWLALAVARVLGGRMSGPAPAGVLPPEGLTQAIRL